MCEIKPYLTLKVIHSCLKKCVCIKGKSPISNQINFLTVFFNPLFEDVDNYHASITKADQTDYDPIKISKLINGAIYDPTRLSGANNTLRDSIASVLIKISKDYDVMRNYLNTIQSILTEIYDCNYFTLQKELSILLNSDSPYVFPKNFREYFFELNTTLEDISQLTVLAYLLLLGLAGPDSMYFYLRHNWTSLEDDSMSSSVIESIKLNTYLDSQLVLFDKTDIEKPDNADANKEKIDTDELATDILPVFVNESEETFSTYIMNHFNPNSLYVLIADGGMGKTTAMHFLMHKLLKNAKIGDKLANTVPVPIYLPLYLLNEKESEHNERFLFEYLFDIYGKYFPIKNTDEFIQYLQTDSKHQYILLLDGLNECTNSNAVIKWVKNFYKSDRITVILSTRNFDDYKGYFKDSKERVTYLALEKLDPDIVKNYLIQNNDTVNLGFIDNSQLGSNFLSIPMFLSIYKTLLTDNTDKPLIFYSTNELLNHYFEKQVLDIHFDMTLQDGFASLMPFTVHLFLPFFARNLFLHSKGHYYCKDINYVLTQTFSDLEAYMHNHQLETINIPDHLENLLPISDIKNPKKQISALRVVKSNYISGYLKKFLRIITIDNDGIRFTHNNFQDYFVAKSVHLYNNNQVLLDSLLAEIEYIEENGYDFKRRIPCFNAAEFVLEESIPLLDKLSIDEKFQYANFFCEIVGVYDDIGKHNHALLAGHLCVKLLNEYLNKSIIEDFSTEKLLKLSKIYNMLYFCTNQIKFTDSFIWYKNVTFALTGIKIFDSSIEDELDDNKKNQIINSAAKHLLEKAKEYCDLCDQSNLGFQLQHSKLVSNLGAFYYRKKDYTTALTYHLEALNSRLAIHKNQLEKLTAKTNSKLETQIITSYITVASDYYWLGIKEKELDQKQDYFKNSILTFDSAFLKEYHDINYEMSNEKIVLSTNSNHDYYIDEEKLLVNRIRCMGSKIQYLFLQQNCEDSIKSYLDELLILLTYKYKRKSEVANSILHFLDILYYIGKNKKIYDVFIIDEAFINSMHKLYAIYQKLDIETISYIESELEKRLTNHIDYPQYNKEVNKVFSSFKYKIEHGILHFPKDKTESQDFQQKE